MKRLIQLILFLFLAVSPTIAEDRQITCTIGTPSFYKPGGNAPSLSFEYKIYSEITTQLKSPVAIMFMLIERENGDRVWARISTSKKNLMITAASSGTAETRSNREPVVHIKSVKDNFVKWPTEQHGNYNRRILTNPTENGKLIVWRIEIWSGGTILAAKNSYSDDNLATLKLPVDWYKFRKYADQKIEYNNKTGEYKMPPR